MIGSGRRKIRLRRLPGIQRRHFNAGGIRERYPLPFAGCGNHGGRSLEPFDDLIETRAEIKGRPQRADHSQDGGQSEAEMNDMVHSRWFCVTKQLTQTGSFLACEVIARPALQALL